MMAMGSAYIPFTAFIFMGITLFITLVLPIILCVVLSIKYKGISSAIIVGALGFYVPQMIIRIPLLQLAGTLPQFVQFVSENTVLYALLLGFTAALFETGGRLVVFYFMKKKLSYQFGLGAGVGHGSIEAIVLVGLTYVNNIIIAAILQMQGIAGLAQFLASEELASTLANTFEQTAPYMYLVAGAERIFTIVFHIAASLIICYGFAAKKLLVCTAVVMIWHTVIDASAVIMSVNGLNVFIIELFIAANAVLALFVAIKIKGKFPLKHMPEEEAKTAVEQGY